MIEQIEANQEDIKNLDISSFDIKSLPPELLVMIISFSDINSLLQMRASCKFFYEFVDNKITEYVNGRKIINIAGNERLMILLHQDRTVSSFKDDALPKKIPNLEEIVQIATNRLCNFFLDASGRVSIIRNYHRFQAETDNKPEIFEDIDDVRQMVICDQVAYYLQNDGTVYQHNIYNSIYHSYTLRILTENITQMAGSGESILLLKDDGTVLVLGLNTYGHLGVGTIYNVSTLSEIPNLKNVDRIIHGVDHTFFILKDKTILGCGYSENGQLGENIRENINEPTYLTVFNQHQIKRILAVESSTFFIKEDGTMLDFGNHSSITTGIRDIEQVQLLSKKIYFLTTDGQIFTHARYYPEEIKEESTLNKWHSLKIRTMSQSRFAFHQSLDSQALADQRRATEITLKNFEKAEKFEKNFNIERPDKSCNIM